MLFAAVGSAKGEGARLRQGNITISLSDKEQVCGKSRVEMVQFGASELAKIAMFPGRCPVKT